MKIRNVLVIATAWVVLLAPVVRGAPGEAAGDAENSTPAAPRVTLKAGDPAPPWRVGQWLKGEPVTALKPGKVYVIECWASWCSTCVAAMPHLTKLQARYKDRGVVVIGLNVLERDPAAAEPFVRKMGERMGYASVADDLTGGPPGKMVQTWLHAAGRKGLPWSFLVDRTGRIAWMGFPSMIDRPLIALAEDRFDAADQAKFEADLDALFAEYAAASRAKDDEAALRVLDRLSALNPWMAPQYAATRISVLLRKGDYAAANAQGRALVGEQGGDDPTLRATVASILLNADDATKVDAAVVVALARHAYDAHDREGWQYAALLARAYAANREFDHAVEVQTRALAGAPEGYREREENKLAEYKKGAAAAAAK